ncbi:MAG: NmrA family NAD(P)-binding protein [Hyphomonadaceae bacterium]
MGKAIVFGGGGAVGEATAHALIAAGWQVVASMRTERADAIERLSQSGATLRRDDLETDTHWRAAANGCDCVVFTTHLSLTAVALARMEIAPEQRVVVFSSNNVAIQPEAKLYVDMAEAERGIRASYAKSAILRPTLIYGDPRLPTLTRLMRMARRFPFVPMPGSGRALLQPVFYEDLGRAAAWLASAQDVGTYAIGGPDSVTMRGIYREVIRASGRRARVLAIPAGLIRILGPVLGAVGLYTIAQSSRVDRDRLVVPQTPLPREIVAKVSLRDGLSRLAAALDQ